MSPDLLDPLLDGRYKGFPHARGALRLSAIGRAGWNVLAGDLPLPIAVIKREALEHNLAWMQARVRDWGVSLAPHGKTTMSPQLFKRQLDAGAWGITFATVTQLGIGVAAGVRRAVIANQIVSAVDLAGIQALLQAHADLRVVFLVDSPAQVELIEDWCALRAGLRPFEVMLEIGIPGGRTGCRGNDEALALAQRIHASAVLRLVGIEAFEGLNVKGDGDVDQPYIDALASRMETVARACDDHGWFEADEVLVSAGGSAIFDLVAARLTPRLNRPVRGLLRSGCYVTHDHGLYARLLPAIDRRLGCGCGESLRPALEVWGLVQSRPEPGLALLSVGRRDLSHDIDLPIPIARAPRGARAPLPAPADWKITGLNDQHAYLRWTPHDEAIAPAVGDRIGLGISHPCTTFDKWHWMPVVENDYRISDAVTTHF